MAPNQDNGGAAARAAWAVATPVVLALAAYTGPGLFLVPMLSLYLDGRSRTWAGLALVLAGAAAYTAFFGFAAGSVALFVAITTAAAWSFARLKTPYRLALAGSAAGGVLGATALLGVLGAALGKALDTAAADWLMGSMAGSPEYGRALDLLTWQIKDPAGRSVMDLLFPAVPQEIAQMGLAEKEALVRPHLAAMAALVIPGVALSAGMLFGALSYHLPQLALHAHRRRGRSVAAGVDVPPFASFKIPKYIVISILLLQVITSLASAGSVLTVIAFASSLLFQVLMVTQALALLSFLLNRRKVSAVFQALILGAALALFFWILSWVGVFDAIFDIRTVMAKVDVLKAKGKKPFTQNGLDELRRMDGSRRGGKNEDDGEDGKP